MKIILTHKYINCDKRIFGPGILKIIQKLYPCNPPKIMAKLNNRFAQTKHFSIFMQCLGPVTFLLPKFKF